MTRIYPVIMSGGAGSRLWPLSRNARPKQLLPLVTDKTMAQETVLRFSDDLFADPVFVCNEKHVDAITAQMADMSRSVDAIIVEPMGRNTAPCAVVAAAHVKARDPNALVLLVPADHHVTKVDAFVAAVRRAVPAANNGKLVTFGIAPDRPETGYGYIERAGEIHPGVFDVKAFKEKPDAQTANTYVESGRFSWNAGLFLFAPETLLEEGAVHAGDITDKACLAYSHARQDGTVMSLDAGHFSECPSDSIDYAIMEPTDKAAVVPCDIGWNDIGSYASLLGSKNQNADGNSVSGDVLLSEVSSSLIHSDGPTVAVVGLSNIAVIVSDGKVLVADLDASQDVKKIVNQLKASDRQDDL